MIVEPREEIVNRDGARVTVVSTLPNGDVLVYLSAEKTPNLPALVQVLFKSDLSFWRKEDI